MSGLMTGEPPRTAISFRRRLYRLQAVRTKLSALPHLIHQSESNPLSVVHHRPTQAAIFRFPQRHAQTHCFTNTWNVHDSVSQRIVPQLSRIGHKILPQVVTKLITNILVELERAEPSQSSSHEVQSIPRVEQPKLEPKRVLDWRQTLAPRWRPFMDNNDRHNDCAQSGAQRG
jgi:hypothetical protein